MSATFRFIHLETDPFTGARFPLGAVVADPRGRVRVAKAGHLPAAECVGASFALSARLLVQELDSVTRADELPLDFGPFARLGQPQVVPQGVGDPVAWLEAMLVGPSAEETSPEARGAQRASLGFRFFETWHVADVVKKTFKPARDWNGWLGAYGFGLKPISHWVADGERVLLMEPILPGRHQFEADVKQVAERFLSYRGALKEVSNGRTGELVAYLPRGGSPEARAQVREQLAPFAHTVVDTQDEAARGQFLETVRTIGSAQIQLAG